MKHFLILLVFCSFAANAQHKKPQNKETRQERFDRIEKLRRERFEAERKQQLKKQASIEKQWKYYGHQVLSISPLTVFTEIPYQQTGTSAPFGFSAAYELFLDNRFSFQLPVFFALNSGFKKFALASKLYSNNARNIRYAFCPTFYVCTHKITDYYYDPFGFAKLQTGRRYSYGLSIDQSLNIIASRHIYLTLSAGPGFIVNEKRNFKYQTLTEIYGNKPADQSFFNFNFNCFIGYRF